MLADLSRTAPVNFASRRIVVEIEGGLTREQVDTGNTQGIDVTGVNRTHGELLWGSEANSPNKVSGRGAVRRVFQPSNVLFDRTKINQNESAIIVATNDILRLNISVNHAMLMDVAQQWQHF